MRSNDEMLDLIIGKAKNDERIRAVTMEGSRSNDNAVHDQYSDFDICYVVSDIREFTKDKSWIQSFGEILIVQCPDDWYNQPYDYDGHDNFGCLIQFKDGNRIDLTLIDVRNIKSQAEFFEPRIVLLNKDNFKELKTIQENSVFYISKPTEMEYNNICNEFRWVSIYITKGLCRKEIYYAKYAYDVLTMRMFMRMLNWKIGVEHEFKVTTGSNSKYLKRYLSKEEMERFMNLFPNGTYEDMWDKLFPYYDYFAELAKFVGDSLGYEFDQRETDEVRKFMYQRKENLL